jgi:hypothetical protein
MHFRAFDAESLRATKTAWEHDAEQGKAFPPDVAQTIDWVRAHTTLTDNSIAYGIFEDEHGHTALAVCEVVISQPEPRKAWVKLLRLKLRPKIEESIFVNDPNAVSAATDAYVSAILGVFALKNVHNATTIKIYGRTQSQMGFLTLLASKLTDRKDAAMKASIEGRWLVLKWSK